LLGIELLTGDISGLDGRSLFDFRKGGFGMKYAGDPSTTAGLEMLCMECGFMSGCEEVLSDKEGFVTGFEEVLSDD